MSLVPTTPERNRDLAKIHAAARRQGMSEFVYRSTLYEVTGKESALLMTAEERRTVIDELNKPAPAPKYADDDCSDEAMLVLLGY
jgi:phage gp16-like protein